MFKISLNDSACLGLLIDKPIYKRREVLNELFDFRCLLAKGLRSLVHSFAHQPLPAPSPSCHSAMSRAANL